MSTKLNNALSNGMAWKQSAMELEALNTELLEALEKLLIAVEGTAGGHLAADVLEGAIVLDARSAIAKARGEK